MNETEIALTQLRYVVMQRLPRIREDHINIAVQRDFDTDTMCAKIEARIWARQVDEAKAEYPATWWDAVKQRFLPQWALRLWPVRLTTVELTAYHAYPELEISGVKPFLKFERETFTA